MKCQKYMAARRVADFPYIPLLGTLNIFSEQKWIHFGKYMFVMLGGDGGTYYNC